MLSTLAIANYRSLRRLVMPLGRLTVVTGPNGSGKSSVYKSLRLLGDIAYGGAVQSLVREGGLPSTLWAGPEEITPAMRRGEQPVQGTVRSKTERLQLGFASHGWDGLSYAIALGRPAPTSVPAPFAQDPEIKHEAVWAGPVRRPASLLVERKAAALRLRADAGWQTLERPIARWASMMTELVDPRGAPEIISLREEIRAWRFYDHFRTDADAPARQPQIGCYTPVLSGDGHDMAAALLTIQEIGDVQALQDAVADAFAGARISIATEGSRLTVQMHQPGLLRPLSAAELSDGTLRYLLLIAALLSPRPPQLLVLNEPETSLHPDLLPALGRLIAQATRQTQLIVVTHANRLLNALEDAQTNHYAAENDENDLPDWLPIHLEKELGETRIANLSEREIPRWEWLQP
ncbi:ATP-binding protein [Comamonas testosteroni]|uniref:ATP-binding protein n=1 Tax=Comamonas testosteroni TaxID=285 RepID=A0A373FMD1_COMTE|nr:AAA family ATPase [Comamonas testosteroni]RGE45087.1 ATP-binding protein [Comamonas testosteroni]